MPRPSTGGSAAVVVAAGPARVGPDRGLLGGLRADLVGRSPPRRRPGRTACATRSGIATAHSSARIPPIEPPTHAGPAVDARARRPAPPRPAPGRRRSPRGTASPTGRRPGRGTTAPSSPGSRRARWRRRRRTGRCPAARPGRSARPTSPAVGCPGPAGPTTWLSPVSACSTSTALPPSGGERRPTSRRRPAPTGSSAAALGPEAPGRSRKTPVADRVPLDPPAQSGVRHALAARKPASRSARMSSMPSRPTARRTRPGRDAGGELLLRRSAASASSTPGG